MIEFHSRPTLCGSLALVFIFATPMAATAQTDWLPPVAPVAPTRTAALTTATPTTTVTRAALVQISDDDAHSPYLEANQAFCTFAGACTVAMSAVPAGHRRVVENVSCLAQIASSGQLQSLTLVASDFTIPRFFIPFVRSGSGVYAVYLGNYATTMKFEAGQTPLLYAFADNVITDLFCSVAGRDVLVP